MNKSKIQKEVQEIPKKSVSSRAEISRRYYLKKSLLEGKVPKNANLDDVKLQKVSKLNTIVEQLKNKKNGITIIPNSKPKYKPEPDSEEEDNSEDEDEDLEVTDDEEEDGEPDSEDDNQEEEPDYRFDELNEKLDAITEMLEFLLKQTKVQPPEEEVEFSHTEKQHPYRRIPKIIFM